MASNLPPGVTDAHPYFNPPPEIPCFECGEDTYPGEECDHCGAEQPSEEDMKFEAELERAEAESDRLRDEG